MEMHMIGETCPCHLSLVDAHIKAVRLIDTSACLSFIPYYVLYAFSFSSLFIRGLRQLYPLLSPLVDRLHYRPQIVAFLGQAILYAHRNLRIDDALNNTLGF